MSEETLTRFGRVMQNWWDLIRAQRNLSLLTGGIGQASSLVPLLVAVPAYLGGHLTLGTVAQVRFAYGQVAGALTWFVNAYQEIARWRANIERLATFAEMMDETERELARAGVQVVAGGAEKLRLANLELDARDGTVRGFSTQRVLAATVEGTRVRAIFSGDTVIDRAYWGEQELVRGWSRFAGAVRAEAPETPLFWFLISKGYRTYLYLPLFFARYFPRHDAPTPPFEQAGFVEVARRTPKRPYLRRELR